MLRSGLKSGRLAFSWAVKPVFVVLVLIASATAVADEFVPPVPKGIAGQQQVYRLREIPFPAANQQWLRVRSRHYDVLSSAPEKRTLETVRNLETLAAALARIHPRFTARPGETRILLFGRRGDVQPIFDMLLQRNRSAAGGAWVAHPYGGTMLLDARRSWRNDAVSYHELVHSFMSTPLAPLPLWLDEGLAEYFSAADVRGNEVRVGRVASHSGARVTRPRAAIPAEQLLAMTPADDLAGSSRFYAQARAVVEWMVRRDREAFYALVGDVESGIPSAAALKSRFGIDVSRLDDAVAALPAAKSSVQTFVVDDVSFEPLVEPVSRASVLVEIGRFLSGFEAAHPDAERFFREARTAAPDDAAPLVALAALRSTQKRFDEASALFEELLARHPADAAAHLAYAESLLRESLGRFAGTLPDDDHAAVRFEKARTLARRAIALGDASPRAQGVFGTTWLEPRDARPEELAAGIAALEEAVAALPNRGDFAINLLTLFARSGSAKAHELYARRFERVRDSQLRFAARSVLLTEKVERINALVRDQRLDDAQVLLREVIEATPDAAARAELERQGRDLARTAAINVEITTYNRAVELVRRGDRAAAARVVDELLRTATDEQVIRDTRELRRMLTGRKR